MQKSQKIITVVPSLQARSDINHTVNNCNFQHCKTKKSPRSKQGITRRSDGINAAGREMYNHEYMCSARPVRTYNPRFTWASNERIQRLKSLENFSPFSPQLERDTCGVVQKREKERERDEKVSYLLLQRCRLQQGLCQTEANRLVK